MAPTWRAGGSASGSGSAGSGDKAVAGLGSSRSAWAPPPPFPPGFPMLAVPLLVAVVLSAQTTDKLVNQVTPALFARAATPAALADLPVEEIKQLIRRIGLSATKAKNLKRLSEILEAAHGGRVPQTLHELEALPGVGHKTASVVLNQGFGHATFAVDTHIHRLAARWGLSSGKSVEQTERDLKKVFPE